MLSCPQAVCDVITSQVCLQPLTGFHMQRALAASHVTFALNSSAHFCPQDFATLFHSHMGSPVHDVVFGKRLQFC